SSESVARGVSADGSVVVGFTGHMYTPNRAFRWTQDGGMQDLGTLPGYSES
ncbi:MAG: HAF repeat-containing protein, partial [Fimbriimonadales bacterium]